MYLEGRAIGDTTGHLAGRELLADMYSRYVGGPMPEILVQQRGKPYFAGSVWRFSISHSQKHVFCALSQKEIGIDAEELDRPANLKLAEKILSPAERQQYEQAKNKERALLTFWVLKEARSKFTGEGLRGYPNHTEFMLSDPRVRELHGCLVAVIEEEDYVI